MREIKFRAWNTNSKAMNYFNNPKDGLLYSCGSLYASTGYDSEDDPTFDKDEDSFIFMQYTGLKDKNGKEIYEGDIIKSEGNLYKVFYNTDIVGFDVVSLPIESNEAFMDLRQGFSAFVLVGNIYENPELLK